MRKLGIALATLIVLTFMFAGIAPGATLPKPEGLVTDAAGLMTPAEKQALEAKLRDYERKTSIEIAVVTVKSLEGLAVEDYAQELGTSWGVGKRGKDNGIVVLLAVAERKIRIHTGYGIEPDLTDAAAGRIIKEDMAPLLPRGHERWSAALAAGAGAIIKGLGEKPFQERLEERKAVKAPAPAPQGDNGWIILVVLLGVGILVVIVVIVARSNSDRRTREEPSWPISPSSPRSRSSSSSSRPSRGGSRGSDFATGVIVGSSLSRGSDGGGSTVASVVSAVADVAASFGGGDFGGGGASGSF